MRKIALKTFDEPVGGMEGYLEILKLVVNTPLNSQRGFDPDDMRMTIRILDKLDEAKGEIVFEDEEWRAVKTKVLQYPFAIAHRELVGLIDAVNDAPSEKK